MSVVRKDKIHSEITRANISAARKGKQIIIVKILNLGKQMNLKVEIK